MAGRFPLYTDADVHGPIVTGLVDRGWDVLRAVDAHPQGTDDDVHFETAAKLGRVLVANDKDQLLIALRWIEEARPFRGYIVWRQKLIDRFPVSAFLDAFDALAVQDDPFHSYPIVYLKPKS